MFDSFNNKFELNIGNSNSYCAKLRPPGVIDVIHQNKALIESFSQLVDVSLTDNSPCQVRTAIFDDQYIDYTIKLIRLSSNLNKAKIFFFYTSGMSL